MFDKANFVVLEYRLMKKISQFFALLGMLVFLSGCIYLVVGSVGALGGYIVSPDTVEGVTEAETGVVWDTAVEVVSIMGLVETQNESGGLIKAKIHNTFVTIMITAAGTSSVKLSVKARKHYLPKISLAQDVFVKIMSRVQE
ncbi:MAG: hypothetical protein A3D87_02905 [Omnitrophica WOR_2 bacterium RIFCSPHIGHO2_02_FULL_50_17]|nr:MAG: hypothetical protein A3D87_02905 [Omnitrophica WOR_2 bacterium RIFCSPHIGHO2_02_FULL_50_17]